MAIYDILKDVEKGKLNEADLESDIEYECAQCGLCCSGSTDIHLTPLDVFRLRQNFNMKTYDLINGKDDEGKTIAWIKIAISKLHRLPLAYINWTTIKSESTIVRVCPFLRAVYYDNVGRNDPCPCGSGNKFKRCCLEKNYKTSCACWANRPATCRLYPVGNVISWNNEKNDYQTGFYLFKDGHCMGWNKGKYNKIKIKIKDFINNSGSESALEFALRFAKVLKKLTDSRFIEGKVDHKHVEILSNILYNFDGVMNIDNDISEEEFEKIIFEKVDEFVDNPENFKYVYEKQKEVKSNLILPEYVKQGAGLILPDAYKR